MYGKTAAGPTGNSTTPVPSSNDRWNRGAWLFRDQTLQALETLLDEAFRIPGTQFRFGLDGIIGLVPGLGDVLAGLLSAVIPIAAWARGVPYITLVRMAANLGIGVLVGTIPLFGDIFDVILETEPPQLPPAPAPPWRTPPPHLARLGLPGNSCRRPRRSSLPSQ